MRIVFDPIFLRPAAWPLQKKFGGDLPEDRFLELFPKDTWLPETYLMSLYEVSPDELSEMVEYAKNSNKETLTKWHG